MIAITQGTRFDPLYKQPLVREKNFRNAAADSAPTGGGWAVTDKIFGYMDKAGNLYNELRYPIVPSPGDANYAEYLQWKRTQSTMLFGLPSPLGIILLVGGIGLVGFIVYKVVTK